MELNPTEGDRQPVVFDIASLGEGYITKDGGVSAAFKFRHAKFEDDLQTAVAMSDGITDDGELNMNMLSAAEAVAAYLENRQGQPIVLTEMVYDKESQELVYLNGYIATLAEVDKIVGLHPDPDDRHISRGIAVAGGYNWFHSYSDFHLNGRLATQYLQPNDANAIPLNQQELCIGVPGVLLDKRDVQDRVARQEVVAGEDIIPWVIENFGDGTDGYHFYMNIIRALTRPGEHSTKLGQLDPLLVEPFVSRVASESQFLGNIHKTLTRYQSKTKDARKVLEGIKGDANLRLSKLAEDNPELADRIPVAATSYPALVTGSLDDPYGEQLEARLKAIEYSSEPLDKLLIWARHRGVIQ